MDTELIMLIAFVQAKQIAGEWTLTTDVLGGPAYTWDARRNGIGYTYWLRFIAGGFEFQEGVGVKEPVRSMWRLLDLIKYGY